MDLELRARAATAQLDLFGFNPGQKRGPDGRWIKMGGPGSAGGKRGPKGGDAPAVSAPSAPAAPAKPARRANPGDGDRVPMADGRTGTVVGGPFVAPGREGKYVAVRVDGDKALTNVKIDSINKRLDAGAKLAPAPAPEPAPALTKRESLERNARIMYGDDESKWPKKAQQDIAKIRRDNPTGAELVEQGLAADAKKAAAKQARKKIIADDLGIGQPDAGPQPVGFTPRSDAEWNLTQKRLGKRTARTDSDGELKPGDIVPTKDGKWAEVLGRDTSLFWERNGLEGIKVRDDSKSYVNTQSSADIKKRIEAYAAEKAWRDAGGSKDRLDGVAKAPVNAQGLRPGEPPIGEDGKYAKPTKQYATWNGEVYTRTSRNPYRYAAVVAFKDPNHPDAAGREGIWSWHRTAESAAKGTLTGDQRRGLYVKAVVETGFEPPANGGPEINANGPAAPAAPAAPARPAPTRAQLDDYNTQIESIALTTRDQARDGELWSGNLDKYALREMDNLISDMYDARTNGNSAEYDRIAGQLRNIMVDNEVHTEDELPTKPGTEGDTPRFSPTKVSEVLDGLFRQPTGSVLYEDGETTLTKADDDESLLVTNKRTGKTRRIRGSSVDAGTINEAVRGVR